MKKTLLISLVISLGAVHAGSGATEVKTLAHGGRTRSYRVHLPPSYREGSPMTLVFVLHGYGGTAAGFEKTIGFNRIADREGFIVVYPNAVAFGAKQKQLWNGGGAYEIWWAGRVNDVSFIAKLIDTVSADYTIDPNRIFVFGSSSGGFMAHHLGARLPGRFAAIASWAGLLSLDDFVTGPPVSVIHFHGEQDDIVYYSRRLASQFAMVKQGCRLWAKRNKCESRPTIIRNDPNILVRQWAAPSGNGDVILYKLKKQDHDMPEPSTCNIPEITWTFFQNHPRSNTKTQQPESQSPAEPFAEGPYLGQTPPGPVAEVFAPGLICDTRPRRWESHASFSADGNTFCFNRLRYVYITENTEHGWTTPERIESIPYHSYSVYLSPDANSIYVRCGPFSRIKRRRTPNFKGFCLRRCMRTPEGWSLPQELGPPFSTAHAGFSVAGNNNIYFKYNFELTKRDSFWVAPFVGDTWSEAINVPVEMGNLKGCCPGIAPDESFLVFYSVKPGAQQGTETNLYLTLREADGTWTKPKSFGPRINSKYYEHGARISPDKKYLFFTRSTGWNLEPACDTSDIYWVELKEYLPESYR